MGRSREGSPCGTLEVCGSDGACVACENDTHCQQPLTGCREAKCVSQRCVEQARAAGVVCNDTGTPGFCGANERCVECTDDTHCVDNRGTECIQGHCEPPFCDNGLKDVGELGTDCGGVCGVPCPDETPGCTVAPDCRGYCDVEQATCRACTGTSQCDAAYFCDRGECIVKARVGDACPSDPIGCTSLSCADGVCCEDSCLGVTRNCLAGNTGEPTGTCADLILQGGAYGACGP